MSHYDIPNILFLDLETRGVVDLPACGVYVYAEHPVTDIYCACYAIGEGEDQVWTPGQPVPQGIIDHVARGGLISAHNFTGFEWVMWERILTPRYGWPAITLEQGHCTAAEAAYLALPRGLEDVGVALGLDTTKDAAGARLMKQMCRPRKTTPAGQVTGELLSCCLSDPHRYTLDPLTGDVYQWWYDEPYDDGEVTKIQRLIEYCGTDVTVARDVFWKLKRLPEAERQVWMLDARINARGVRLDIPAIRDAQAIVDQALEAADQVMSEMTDGKAVTVNQRARILAWLQARGLVVTALDKNAVEALLQSDLEKVIRENLESEKAGLEAVLAAESSIPTETSAELQARLSAAKAEYQTVKAFRDAWLSTEPDALAAFEFDTQINPERVDLQYRELADEIAYLMEAIAVRSRTEVAVARFAEIDGLLAMSDPSADVRRLLETRRDAGAASVKKLKAMLACANEDFRARGCFLYSGAGTHRWAGQKIQLQNLKRDTNDDIETALESFRTRDLSYVELMLGPAIPAVSKCLRGMIRAEDGKILYIADYSNIEGRVNAWLAGETAKLEAFAAYDRGEGADLYKVAASGIYGVPVEEVTKNQRQVGKVTELACLGGSTRVLTDNGIKLLTAVTVEDRVWDGVEWVCHEGVIAKGSKTVCNLLNLELTPDHEVRAYDGWRPALDLHQGAKLLAESINSTRDHMPVGAPVLSDLSFPRHTAAARTIPVFDILNAGPRNRFTVYTAAGPLIVHNCGYQGGVGAFAKMAQGYGVDLAAMLPALWASAPRDRKRAALKAWLRARKRPQGRELGRAAFVASDLAKQGWRAANPAIAAMWKLLQRAAMAAVKNPGEVFTVGRIRYVVTRGFLWCALPSGRRLAYAAPRITEEDSPWDDQPEETTDENGELLPKKERKKIKVITYLGVDSITRKFTRQKLYGGLACENIVQSVARDLLAEAMLRVEAAGYPVVLHAHDEIVAEVPVGFGSVKEFGDLMCVLPEWGEGLPLAWAGEESFRYKK